MKVARLVGFAFAVALIANWASGSSACDKDKASAAAAQASGVCTAKMASACTPEMAAACKAKMDAAAVVASANGACATAGMKAVAASASGKAGCCEAKGVSARAASHASCAMKNVSAAQCTAHGMGVMAAAGPMADCDACLDASNCNDALDAAGAHRQAVRLRNGVMYVYTADTRRNVSAVQAAVARRDERMSRIASAGESAHLCPECKTLRGAIASGKLTREVIEIEGGALTLITSTDAATVAKLHAMVEPRMAARIKS